MKIRNPIILILIAVVIFVLIFSSGIVSFAIDWWWFTEVGLREILVKSLAAKLICGSAAGLITFCFLFLNFIIAAHSKIPWVAGVPASVTGQPLAITDRWVKRAGIIICIIVALLTGLVAASYWLNILQFINSVPFDRKDPLLNMDIGFYVFSLPVYTILLGIAKFLVFLAIIGCGIIYMLRGKIKLSLKAIAQKTYDKKATLHAGILLSLFFLLMAIGTRLSIYGLLNAQGAPISGATFTDANIIMPILRITFFAYILAGIMAMFYGISNKIMPLLAAVLLTFLSGGINVVIPSLYQRFIVAPNELVKETPYIKNNIESTRQAFGLDKIEKREIDPGKRLSFDDIVKNNLTIKNVRLWDRDPLLSTFSQIQEIRTYYEFISIDNDRYDINGEIRQIMLSPREMATNSLPNKNWINEHLTFTHGYGIAAGPVNQVTNEGLPVLFVKDLPPKSDVKELIINRPEIYYGEMANDFVIANTNSQEFDYPKGDENVYTSYKGKGGVQMDSLLKRLLFTLHFNSLKILLSSDVTNTSRILFNREVKERVAKIVPFLDLDRDPYLVAADGKLYWIIDAYTSTSEYPYSHQVTFNDKDINYVRNSVKAVVDAYDGSVKLYIADPNDPIIKSYARIFPGAFHPLSEIQASLKSHLRYPEDIFTLQTGIYTTYHMDNPRIFYNKEDQWEIPSEAQGNSESTDNAVNNSGAAAAMAPRHIIMKLPDEKQEEFIFMLPFTPRAKDNLSAWMIARNDGENYGKLAVYSFPKDQLIYGPKQVTGRINQDAEVSRQISLWDQRGSQVIQGPLMIIPIENSLLYIRPLYLQAETGKIPELKRVIVAYENKIAMEESLEQSLAKIFGTSASQSEIAKTTSQSEPAIIISPTPNLTNASESLIQQANDAYTSAINAQKTGDWTKYGEEIKKLGDLLEQLK